MTQTDPPRPARETLPTMYDLPSEEIGDAGMPDEYHVRQAILLDQTFRPSVVSPDEIFCNCSQISRKTNWRPT